MADDFALVRIVKVNNPDSTTPTIKVKQLAVSQGHGSADDGDLQVLDIANGTDVKIAIARKLTDDQGKQFAFKDKPICIYDLNANPPAGTCAAGDMPNGFSYTLNATKDVIALTVPQLNTGSVAYKYRLFMEMTKSSGQKKDVTIDPKITNGGNPFTDAATAPPPMTPVTPVAGGLTPLALIGSAILLVSLGVALGMIATKA